MSCSRCGGLNPTSALACVNRNLQQIKAGDTSVVVQTAVNADGDMTMQPMEIPQGAGPPETPLQRFLHTGIWVRGLSHILQVTFLLMMRKLHCRTSLG